MNPNFYGIIFTQDYIAYSSARYAKGTFLKLIKEYNSELKFQDQNSFEYIIIEKKDILERIQKGIVISLYKRFE